MTPIPYTQYYYNEKVALISRSNGNGTMDLLVLEESPYNSHCELDIPISELVPIEITEEVLRKCKECRYNGDYEFEYRDCKITIQSDGAHFYCIMTNSNGDEFFRSPVTYLHEIQEGALTVMPSSVHPKLKP